MKFRKSNTICSTEERQEEVIGEFFFSFSGIKKTTARGLLTKDGESTLDLAAGGNRELNPKK